ncbi:ribosome-inactivating family protein [Streptomyces sp. NPDC001389]|uniref:ribosome-inactivating family protein n=1 Tax=unclassified Streptomyces TaxID=2593676 RepID=UPI003678CD7B
MHTTITRDIVRRITLALALLGAVLSTLLAAPTASALPRPGINPVDWDITSMVNVGANAQEIAGRYEEMIREFREIAHSASTGTGNSAVTSAVANRIIELRIIDRNTPPGQVRGHQVSLYFRSDNLYLMGFWSANGVQGHLNTHYAFNDFQGLMQQNIRAAGFPTVNVDSLGIGSNYAGRGNLDAGDRGQRNVSAGDILRSINVLRRLGGENYNQANMQAALTQLIQVTAESVRFDVIARHHATNMRLVRGNPIGILVELENLWGPLSRWVNTYFPGRQLTITVLGQTYTNPLLLNLQPAGNPGQGPGLGYMMFQGGA